MRKCWGNDALGTDMTTRPLSSAVPRPSRGRDETALPKQATTERDLIREAPTDLRGCVRCCGVAVAERSPGDLSMTLDREGALLSLRGRC